MPNTVANRANSAHYVHVVAAVIYHSDQSRILIARRPGHLHQGGKWEFPGGKVEPDETPQQALSRELFEELGIQLKTSESLIQIHHQYADKAVFLDVYNVTAFSGEAYGKEGQTVCWVQPASLGEYTFPDANIPVIRAIQLPRTCLITPEPADQASFLSALELALQRGIPLLQFRAKQLEKSRYAGLAQAVIELAHRYQAKVLLNSPDEMHLDADGLHLTSQQLMSCRQRPQLPGQQSLSASCHNEKELRQAGKLGVDFVFLSPVKMTRSHPEAVALGWNRFQQLVSTVNLPVYALGGVGKADIPRACQSGAQGIAAISALWDK